MVVGQAVAVAVAAVVDLALVQALLIRPPVCRLVRQLSPMVVVVVVAVVVAVAVVGVAARAANESMLLAAN